MNYDNNNWNRLIHFLEYDKHEMIHKLNRAQLIDDAFQLFRAGRVKADIPLRLCRYLVKEDEYVAFAAFYNNLKTVDTMLAKTVYYSYLQVRFKQDLLEHER